MMPEYVRLNEDTRRVVRRRPQIGTSMAVWWCPFCDHSQVEGQTACGKCGAIVVTNPIAAVAISLPPMRGDEVAAKPVIPVRKGGNNRGKTSRRKST